MRKLFQFKSLYVRLVVTFIGIWWFINWFSFGMIFRAFAQNTIFKSSELSPSQVAQIVSMRGTVLTILAAGILLGTLAIVHSSRSIVKPIKELSKAAREVAQGKLNVYVKPVGSDEISRLAKDFNIMTQALISTDKLHKEFVSNVSHEFKTPVTSIRGFAKLVRDGNLEKVQMQEYCDIIIEESERLSNLAQDLLKLSELENSVIQENVVLIAVDEQIRKAVVSLEPLWSKKEIEIELNLEKISFNSNLQSLQQVWNNLLTNAIKFSDPKSTINIELVTKDDKLHFTIQDHGIGIKEEDQTRIFERFYQADTSRAEEGHGLGLVIVKKIVEKAGGTISVNSVYGEGTTFIVELPMN